MHEIKRNIRRRLGELDIRQPAREGDRRASVLLLILERGEPVLLAIARGTQGSHPGQFGLPGGRPEPVDASSWDTAIREAREEIGLEDHVESLGFLGEYNTRASRFQVDVHVGWLHERPRWRPDGVEVAGVLEVPFSFLEREVRRLPEVSHAWELPIEAGFEFDAAPFLMAGEVPERGVGHRLLREGRELELPFVWGLTARVLYDFIRLVWRPATAACGETLEPRRQTR
ncbi:MAG: CoA pyrophosphatase [Planctomycetota bacterium]